MIELFAQFAFVDEVGKPDMFGAVDQAECDMCVGFVTKHGLAHEEFVEISVDQGPDDWINLPLMVPDTSGNIDHGSFLISPDVFLPFIVCVCLGALGLSLGEERA